MCVGLCVQLSATILDTLFTTVMYPSSERLHKVEVSYPHSQCVIYLLSAVSVTTTHAQYIKNKQGYLSADAELEDLGGTSRRAPKKKGPQVVKF